MISDPMEFSTLIATAVYACLAVMALASGAVEQRARLFYAGGVLLALTPVAAVGFAHYIHAAAGAMP